MTNKYLKSCYPVLGAAIYRDCKTELRTLRAELVEWERLGLGWGRCGRRIRNRIGVLLDLIAVEDERLAAKAVKGT